MKNKCSKQATVCLSWKRARVFHVPSDDQQMDNKLINNEKWPFTIFADNKDPAPRPWQLQQPIRSAERDSGNERMRQE